MKKRILSFVLAAVLITALLPSALAAAPAPWDGKTIDVSWYDAAAKELYISTPEQLMGLAAIVNGIYNKEITAVIGDAKYIVANYDGDGQEIGSMNRSTDSYYYGADDFNGKTVYLTADLDMGGTYNAAADAWTGPNYMPIGGQYLMELNNAETKLGSSFSGTLDGQGHYIRNIYCNRRCTTGNFGDGSSVGLIGRLGIHDNDPAETRPVNPTVRNLAVTGYIYANRSVGGIVGKIGKTGLNNGDGSIGGIIENCANFATVKNTDAKGCGGIVGAGWNGGIIRNCYNSGSVISTYTCPTGGISGSNEIAIENCYSVGTISAMWDSFAMGIGSNNGGGNNTDNCYWLEGSAAGGGYYGANKGTVTALTSTKMKSSDTITKLGNSFTADTKNINNGYPILTWQSESEPAAAFTDVSSSAWYSAAVRYVADAGLFNGTSDTTFSPNSTMTRAMFVTVMGRLDSAELADYTIGSFTDVPPETWYARSVNWAAATGLVNGTGGGKFSPDATISLEAMALVLYRYSGEKAVGDTVSANVGAVSAWAREAMAWAEEQQLFNGVGGTLQAGSAATRAQVAQILLNTKGALDA